jgi:3',5'-cyclic-AMP phosphodiesterase
MTRIAHLTDLHLLEEAAPRRTGAARARLEILTLGRSKNPERRRLRALHALLSAREAGADHLVLTGDLTEDGLPEQLQVLAEVLAESGWVPGSVTMVPGNHDMYGPPDGWARAFDDGPLAAFRAESAPAAVIERDGVTLVAFSTARPQHYAFAGGAIHPQDIGLLRRVATETRRSGRALVLVQHHPPRHALGAIWPVDGLRDQAALGQVLDSEDHLHVVHGHTHAARDRAVRPGGPPRIFSAEAVVDSPSALRLYQVRHGRLWAEAEPGFRAAAVA